jgi:hypothetical protein
MPIESVDELKALRLKEKEMPIKDMAAAHGVNENT